MGLTIPCLSQSYHSFSFISTNRVTRESDTTITLFLLTLKRLSQHRKTAWRTCDPRRRHYLAFRAACAAPGEFRSDEPCMCAGEGTSDLLWYPRRSLTRPAWRGRGRSPEKVRGLACAMLVDVLSRCHVSFAATSPPSVADKKGLAPSLIHELAAWRPSQRQHCNCVAFRLAAQEGRARTSDLSSLIWMSSTGAQAAGMAQQCPNSSASERRFQLPPISPGLVLESERTARLLGSEEWEDILGQINCLEYISPDIEQCMAAHHLLHEAEHELELTGREFLASPSIPTILLHTNRVPRRPGLRERIARPSFFTESTRPAQETCRKNRRPRTKRKQPARSAEYDQDAEAENQAPNRALEFGDSSIYPQRDDRERLSLDARAHRQMTTLLQRSQTVRKSKDCKVPGCTKGARSKGLCKRHGGGKRCTHIGCSRSDQGGGFCIAHGGGKRCAYTGCSNSAQSRGLCKTHGGSLDNACFSTRRLTRRTIIQEESAVLWTAARGAARIVDFAAATPA